MSLSTSAKKTAKESRNYCARNKIEKLANQVFTTYDYRVGIKHRVNENFFTKWSSNMAYLLGYIYADGDLIYSPSMRGKYVSVASTEKNSIQKIKRWLGAEHVIREKKSHFTGSHTCFVLRIGSHKIYNDLVKFGLHPNKSLTIKFPNIPKKYLGHFIRGYFDGDGCVHLARSMGKTKKLIIKRVRVIFTSGSKVFLVKMNAALKDFGIIDGKIYRSKRSYQAIYNTGDSVRIFKLIYKNAGVNSFFMRKFKVFNNYFKLRPVVVDKIIKRIIDGHVVKQLTQRSAKPPLVGANPTVASKFVI